MRLIVAAVLLALAGSASGSPEASYQIVVSPSNGVKAVKKAELAKLFLRKASRWPDGRPAQPVDQSATYVVRQAFTHDVLAAEGVGKLSSVETYWRQQVFSGRGAPPRVLQSDAEVLAFVAANEGAVGYVAPGVDVTGARVLPVED